MSEATAVGNDHVYTDWLEKKWDQASARRTGKRCYEKPF